MPSNSQTADKPSSRKPDASFSLKQNALFLKVASSRTLSGAAQTLHMSASSVTRQLIDLELAMGLTLLDRAHGTNKLTQAGQVFLPYCQRIFQAQLAIAQFAKIATDSSNPIGAQAPTDETAVRRVAVRLTLAQIHAFISVAQDGGFCSAARTNQQTQSNLSRLLKDMESVLGVSLLSRMPAGIALTSVGKFVLPLAEQLLALHTQASNCLRLQRPQANSYLLIVGSLSVMPPVMSTLLKQLKADLPRHHIEVRNELSVDVEKAVHNGSAIVGLCGVVREKPHFIYTPLLQVQLGLIWAPRMNMPHLPSSLDELAHIAFLRFHDGALTSEALTANQTRFSAYFDSHVTVDSVEAGLDLVRNGDFAMVATGVGASRKAAQGLNFLPLPHLLPSLTVSIISRRESPLDERHEQVRHALACCVLQTRWHGSVKLLKQPAI